MGRWAPLFSMQVMVNFVNQTPGVAIGPLQTVNFDNGTSMAILKGAYGQVGYFLTGSIDHTTARQDARPHHSQVELLSSESR